MNTRRFLTICLNLLILILLTGCELKQNKEEPSSISQPLASLTETYWKLLELGGQEVKTTSAKKREIHFILHSSDNRVVGFNGCNRFFGHFNATADAKGQGELRFKALGATKMACPDLDIKEQQVMQPLYNQSRYHITGESLILLDDNAKPLAKFAAIYF